MYEGMSKREMFYEAIWLYADNIMTTYIENANDKLNDFFNLSGSNQVEREEKITYKTLDEKFGLKDKSEEELKDIEGRLKKVFKEFSEEEAEIWKIPGPEELGL